MKRLPSAKKLSTSILATPSGKGTTLAGSVSFLLQRRSDLSKYASVESLVTAPDDDQSKLRKACEHHIGLIRAQLARELWSRQLFIGVSVLDDMLFRAIAHGTTINPVLHVLEAIRDEELHHPGLVLFPVHSFGVLGAGLLHGFTDTRIEYMSKAFGIALSPQTNSLKATIRFLEHTREHFGIRRTVPSSLISHWLRTRTASWLTRNPLLAVKVQSFPGGYYENQSLLLSTLRFATALVSMLATLQPSMGGPEEKLSSSSMVNNYQTLDIRHYAVFYNNLASPGELAGDFVPMHLQAPALAEVSDLGIELNPRFWRKRRVWANRIHQALNTVHSGYIKHGFGPEKDRTLGRTYRKLFESLAYFRRSFRSSADNWTSIVSLAIAFEMLLTDGYAKKVNERIVRRARLALSGVPGSKKYAKSVDELYQARGGIVHTGTTRISMDIQVARRAFVYAFVAISSKLSDLSPTSSTPMKDLAGDSEA
jgi:hypothetical protein